MDQSNVIQYEHPLNERYRFFLRLEYLFNLLSHSINSDLHEDSHNALAALLDIINVVSRIDLKSETLKEMDRLFTVLKPLLNAPNIEQGRLDEILASLKELGANLRAINGPIDLPLREIELLKVLQLRNGIPGGMCDFDLPQFRHWLHQPADKRINDIRAWRAPFDALRYAIGLILKLVRESTSATQEIAEDGLFKQTLDTSTPLQLIIISLPQSTPYFVEFSGSKHRFTARFMEAAATPRPAQTTQNVTFNLSCCTL